MMTNRWGKGGVRWGKGGVFFLLPHPFKSFIINDLWRKGGVGGVYLSKLIKYIYRGTNANTGTAPHTPQRCAQKYPTYSTLFGVNIFSPNVLHMKKCSTLLRKCSTLL